MQGLYVRLRTCIHMAHTTIYTTICVSETDADEGTCGRTLPGLEVEERGLKLLVYETLSY